MDRYPPLRPLLLLLPYYVISVSLETIKYFTFNDAITNITPCISEEY
jgi:hypothetical protein